MGEKARTIRGMEMSGRSSAPETAMTVIDSIASTHIYLFARARASRMS